jgi:DNA-binding beta-propeller fold protein YncE
VIHQLFSRRRATRPGALTLCAALALTTFGCDDDGDGAAAGSGGSADGGAGAAGGASGSPADACAALAFDAQPHARFVLGGTFYLPGTSEACAAYTLEEAPDGAAAAVVDGADGVARFTPDVAGTFRFVAADRPDVELTVVAEGPFVHHNYYPTRSLARVGDELWVAEAYNPRISRLDATTLEPAGAVAVGAWPVALAVSDDVVLVAQRGADSLGVVDVASGTLVDAIPVGDEPANVVAHEGRAYVALATEAAIAIVDVAERAVVERIATVPDPQALALSPDGGRLYIASHRSGHPERAPYGEDPVEEERDFAILDTQTLEAVEVLNLGTTLGALHATADRVYLAGLTNEPTANLANLDEPNFFHRVWALDASTGEVLADVDVGRQDTSGGPVVTLAGLAEHGGAIWVTAEGSDVVVGLDPASLAEVGRFEATGRPRAILSDGDAAFVHGAQGFAVTRLEGEDATEGTAGTDPRPDAVARGQRYFTGAGRDFAVNWSCNSCHAQGLTDTLIWNAGPFEDRVVSRPFFWLDGTWPLGWAGYLTDVRNYAYTVNTNVGIRPTTGEADDLEAYLASLMPPPAANHRTRLDGTLGDEAERGRALYEGEAQCVTCHALPLTTNRASFDPGVTAGVTDVPALVGIYRHNVWLKHGEARTLRAAVDAVLAWREITLSDEDAAALTAYVEALTGRDFFLLGSTPRAGERVEADAALRLVFSMPVLATAENLGRIALQTVEGQAVDAEITAEGNRVFVAPRAPLADATRYEVLVGADFEAFHDRAPLFGGETRLTFRTVDAPMLRLQGDYVWTVDVPAPDFENNRFDNSVSVPVPVAVNAAEDGTLTIDFGDDLTYTTVARIDGDQLAVPPLPVSAAASFADSSGLNGTLSDEDGDGVADRVEGELTMTGPGFVVPGVTWRIERGAAEGECPEGTEGPIDVTVDRSGDAPVITWGDGETNALGVYVTDPGVQLPLGPGAVVRGGDTYWALDAIDFPGGFAGPVTYGTVPEGAMESSERHGGPAGGAPLEAGRCYQFSVISARFEIANVVLRY